MKHTTHLPRPEGAFRAFAIVTVLFVASANAQPVIAPTVRVYFSATPVPFEQANAATLASAATAAYTAQTTSVPLEIAELARALKNDPDLIYQYVHDNIEFSPLWGLLKGPVGTLLDGRGDAFDQAALMVALLNQASLANPAISGVGFEFGALAFSSAQLQSWLGVDSNPSSVSGVLAQGLIPASVFANGDAIVGHVWVKVSINGTPYVFDPAFKEHTWKTGIISSLPGIIGYSKGQFLSDAGASVSPTSIQNVNRTNLRNDLTTYAGNLGSFIRSNMPNAGVNDVVGGGTIVPASFVGGQTVRQSANPNQHGSPTDWAAIPSPYKATFAITVPGASAQTFNSADIYGHRLSIFFNSSYVPTLYLDGSPVVSGSPFTQGAEVGINLSVSIPWAASANQSRTQFIGAQTNENGGSGGYVVVTGWDQVGRGMIEKHRKLLQQAINSGEAANSELVLGESLAMLGYTWLAECAAQQRLSDQLLGTTTDYYYGGGIIGEAVGKTVVSPYVDLGLNLISAPSRLNGNDTLNPNEIAAFLDASGVSSAFESTTLEQTQNLPGFAAASTVKLLDIAIQNGDTIFDINNDNSSAGQQAYTNTIRPQLVPNYAPVDLLAVDASVAQGFRVIAPLHGRIQVGSWTGVGFKTLEPGGGYGEIISGGLSGGTGTGNLPPGTVVFLTAGSMIPGSTTIVPADGFYTVPGSTGTIIDPVDHLKGSFQYRNTDLSAGAKSFPYGLSFERSYDSGAQGISGPLGFGWTHNFVITATVGSDGFTGMGQASPLSAVNSIVALYVSSDLMKGQAFMGQPNLEYFTLETVVNRWFTEQLTQNAVYVSQGWNSEQFTRQVDGSYAPPVGSVAVLDAPGGTFRYRTKTGVTMNFNSAGQISSWQSAAGAALTFTYTGRALATVQNAATGRHLSFNYVGNQLSSVSDGTRTVSYGYTSGNLTTFTDALNQNTIFAYDTTGMLDTNGHLTQIFYPSNPSNPFVTSFYDSLGRVAQQKDANGNATQAFFAGARTEIHDPSGNQHVWYNDPRGNVTAEIQDYGPSPHLNVTTLNAYGGQSELLTTVMPEGNSVSYTYDALLNPLSITNTPKPGSRLSPQIQRFTYVVPVSSLPNFEEVKTDTDPNNNDTTYTYNIDTGTLAKTDQPAVPRPGAGMLRPQLLFTYTPIGLLQTSQDAEGLVTRYDYDNSFADQVIKVTIDYGRLNLVTQYAYDSFGDINSITDANGHTTTKQFDYLRRVIEVDGAIGGVATKYTYSPDGQVSTKARQVSPGNWETTQYAYTPSGKIHVVTDPLGNTVSTTYDADDRIQTVTTQVTTVENRQRAYSYDALGRIYQINDTTAGAPGTPLEMHAYTLNGNPLSITDPNNNSTRYVYDAFDRMSQTVYPDGTTENYRHDANGNVVQKITRSRQAIVFTYDGLNRVATKTPQGESAGQVAYGYDLTGRLLQAFDASSAVPYQIGYDTAGRANSFTDQQGRNTQAQYDAAGNRIRLQWPANTNGASAYYVTYSFDAMNRMTEVDANGSSATPLAKYQWDAISRLTATRYGDGTSDSYLQYDAGDNLLALNESFNGGTNVTFNYGWLKNHQRQSTQVNDNLTQYIPPSEITSYSRADVDNGYASVGAASVTYDENHNLTFDGFNTLKYDVENRLIQSQNIGWGTTQYFYDPLGHRKQKSVGDTTTQYVLAGEDEIADYAGTGIGTPQMLTVRGVGGLPVAGIAVSGDSIAFYHHDVLGSTIAATEPGRLGPSEVYTYGDFGTVGAGSTLMYRFGGYRYDPETGLYYVRARYYSPQLGRFLQTDPIGYAGGLNLYAYVDNDPVNRADSFGTCPNPQGCAVRLTPSGNITLLGTYDSATGTWTPTAIAGPLAVLNLGESFITNFVEVFNTVLLPLATAGGSTAIDYSTTVAGVYINLKAGSTPGKELVTTIVGFFVGALIAF